MQDGGSGQPLCGGRPASSLIVIHLNNDTSWTWYRATPGGPRTGQHDPSRRQRHGPDRPTGRNLRAGLNWISPRAISARGGRGRGWRWRSRPHSDQRQRRRRVRNTTADRFVPPPGDANRDGQFDRRDVILVLQMGKYLTGRQPRLPRRLDGDGWFDRLDIIEARETGDYYAGP